MPATEPTGSMAIAPKLDTDKLKHAIVMDCTTTKAHSGSALSEASTTCSATTPMNASSAACEIRRMPKRSTRREFVKAAIPMNTAHSANIEGMRLAR